MSKDRKIEASMICLNSSKRCEKWQKVNGDVVSNVFCTEWHESHQTYL